MLHEMFKSTEYGSGFLLVRHGMLMTNPLFYLCLASFYSMVRLTLQEIWRKSLKHHFMHYNIYIKWHYLSKSIANVLENESANTVLSHLFIAIWKIPDYYTIR